VLTLCLLAPHLALAVKPDVVLKWAQTAPSAVGSENAINTVIAASSSLVRAFADTASQIAAQGVTFSGIRDAALLVAETLVASPLKAVAVLGLAVYTSSASLWRVKTRLHSITQTAVGAIIGLSTGTVAHRQVSLSLV